MYKNGNYSVFLFKDGTKIRVTKDDSEFIPAFAENCDVKITNRCGVGCPFCYEGCTRNGKHGKLLGYDFIKHLHPETEMALNGNDLDHPELEDFLHLLKEQKVYANITVHQSQFFHGYEKLKRWQSEGLIHGIGVSVISGKIGYGFIEGVKSLENVVLHTIVGVLTPQDISDLSGKDLKVLLLGYKDLQRGIGYKKEHQEEVQKNTEYLRENLKDLIPQFEVLSFDNLAISQLEVKNILPDEQWEEFYMGDDGQFTFYIDMVKGEYAKNSLATERFPIGEKTIDEMFNHIRTL